MILSHNFFFLFSSTSIPMLVMDESRPFIINVMTVFSILNIFKPEFYIMEAEGFLEANM